ncbi:GGDEF domain-containing protein [Butyrivibrio fibrisolvens]|uniref:GGDEF domain-containing protein n=1 Tax=Butyrivibrio fibrisolvens TaxID=831 RepID=UPI0004077399|nr:GGDEF domain-containing protein [Butyrivibrio fibrisolvens]
MKLRFDPFFHYLFKHKSPEIVVSITAQNIYCISLIAIVNFFIELYFSLWNYSIMILHPEIPHLYIVIRLNSCVMMMLISAAVFLYLLSYRNKVNGNVKKICFFLLIYSLIEIAFGIYISVYDLLLGGNSYVFFIMTLCVFGILVINPYGSITLSIISLVSFYLVLIPVYDVDYSDVLNMTEYFFFINFISVIRYYLTCTWYENHLELKKVNEELILAKEQLEKSNEKLHSISFYDELSCVKNRNALRTDWSDYNGHILSVMMMDIDDFKYFNDTFGHTVGDNVIREVARLLSKYFGIEHCYRIGGDEFLIISGYGKKSFEERISLLRKDLTNYRIEEADVSPTISCGIYRGVCDYENDLRVLKDIADELLYKVKKTGKNGFMFKADPLLPTGDIDIDDSSISLKGAMESKINNSIS